MHHLLRGRSCSRYAFITAVIYSSFVHQTNCTPIHTDDSHMHVTIVKFGGSSITNKHVFESLRHDALDITAKQVNEVLALGCGKRNICVIHGAGSFGHFQVNCRLL